MSTAFSHRNVTGFSLIELLLVVAVIGVLSALLLSATNRSKEGAKRVTCQHHLRQFYVTAAMYAQEHEGVLSSYGDFLKGTPMLCPSDKDVGAFGEVESGRPTSFRASPFVFASRKRLDECESSWWVLVEYHPYHDLSKKPGVDAGKWRGRFNSLMADGVTRWELLEQ